MKNEKLSDENINHTTRVITIALFGIISLLLLVLAYSTVYAIALDPIKYISI